MPKSGTLPSRNNASARLAPWVAIADPGDVRASFFSAACARAGLESAILDYRQVLADSRFLDEIPDGAVVRIESPGRAFDIHAALIARGGGPLIERPDKGLIFEPSRWFSGFSGLLLEIEARLGTRVSFSSHPREILQLFDKCECHARLSAAGLPVPRSLRAISGYQSLRAAMYQLGTERVFVKLRYGSGASGIVAFRTQGERRQALTTVQRVSMGRLYNTRKIRRLEREGEIAELIDDLCALGVHVEDWIPKAGFDGRCCDLRVLTIGGEPRFTVLRLSKHPMTNLHLRNERADGSKLAERAGSEAWQAMLQSCRGAARCFPRCLHIGIDVAFTPGLRRHFILEANAFGDLLKEVKVDGMNTYECELQEAACTT